MKRNHKRRMTCCVCGADAGTWSQHWNRDDGFGVCVKCVNWQRGRGVGEGEILSLYGKLYVNWGDEALRSAVSP